MVQALLITVSNIETFYQIPVEIEYIKLDKISVHILTAISRFGQEMTSFNRSTVFYLVMRLTNINTSFLIQREENGMTITSLITRDHF